MSIAPARPASTVVLLRPAPPHLEVFLVRRDDNVAFMGGAHVFPGGRVDAGDHLEQPELVCDGVAAAAARLPDLPAADAVAFHVAAIRELFEEAGVLLARTGAGALVAIDRGLDARYEEDRRALAAGEVTLADIARRERLRLALDTLALFAHWVTPAIETRRFDTRFFLALAPGAQHAAHDNRETTHGEWITPSAALAQCRAGTIALPPPTWTTLRMLERVATVEAAWEWARTSTVPTVQPGFEERPDGSRLVLLPGDPTQPRVDGFDVAETRFVLSGGRWAPAAAPGSRE